MSVKQRRGLDNWENFLSSCGFLWSAAEEKFAQKLPITLPIRCWIELRVHWHYFQKVWYQVSDIKPSMIAELDTAVPSYPSTDIFKYVFRLSASRHPRATFASLRSFRNKLLNDFKLRCLNCKGKGTKSPGRNGDAGILALGELARGKVIVFEVSLV